MTADAIVNIGPPHVGFGDEKKRDTTVTETELGSRPSPPRPHLNRRTSSFRAIEDDGLTNFGRAVYKLLENPIVRYAIYVLPVGGLLAIPLTLFATKYRDHDVDGVHTVGLFLYIEIIWVFLWISKLIAAGIPFFFQGVCGLISTGIRKYALMLRAVEIPLSLFIWTIFCICWLPIIHVFDINYYTHVRKSNIYWLNILAKVIKASIGSAALLLAEKMLVQLISVSYHGKQYQDKIKDIKYTSKAVDLLYEASLKTFPSHSPETLEEDYIIHDTTNVQKLLKQYSADRTTMRVFGDIHYYGEKLVSIFGRMASDITGTQVLRPTATHAVVESALERKAGAEAMARRIFKSLVQPDNDCIYEKDIIKELGAGSENEASFIFAQLDRDGNGDVSLEEMIMLVCGISQQRKDMWRSACNIRDAIKVLDHVLSFIILVVVALIYSAFFSNFLSNNLSKIVTLLSASAFSFGQTVGEFNAACILVFVKHPFDVGDRVNMNDHEYEVVRISLLYTVFRRIDTDTISQVANQIVGNLWIDNVSRSKAMKERYTFSVSAGTSFHDIEILRAELQAFVRAPENSRDFQPDVDIQLVSVGDLKQLDLRVEIRHKVRIFNLLTLYSLTLAQSNWAIDALRAYRRSKFMCALLSAMRKVPIDGPAGSGPERGSINAPNYSVTISDAEAKATRAAFDEAKSSKKFVPTEAVVPEASVPGSTGLEILPSHRTFGDESGLLRSGIGELFQRRASNVRR